MKLFTDWCQFGAGRPRRDAYRLARHVLLYPLMALLFTFTSGKIAKSFNVPFARYYFSNLIGFPLKSRFQVHFPLRRVWNIHHLADRDSLLQTGQRVEYPRKYEELQFSSRAFYLPESFEAYFFSYVLGMLLERYIMLSRIGPQQYLMFWWRW